jgi:hypothetical protein
MTVALPSGTPNTSEIVSVVFQACNLVTGTYTYSTTNTPDFDMVKTFFFSRIRRVQEQVLEIQKVGLRSCVWTGVRADQAEPKNLHRDEALKRLDRARELHGEFICWLDSQVKVAALMEANGMAPHLNEGEVSFLRNGILRLDETIEETYRWVAKQEALHQAIRSLIAFDTELSK